MALISELYLAWRRFDDSLRKRIHFFDKSLRIDPVKPAILNETLFVSRLH